MGQREDRGQGGRGRAAGRRVKTRDTTRDAMRDAMRDAYRESAYRGPYPEPLGILLALMLCAGVVLGVGSVLVLGGSFVLSGFHIGGAVRPLPQVPGTEGISDWSRVIAYVPLDDRTDNLESTVLLAEASGYTLLLPERDWFRTALDGQARNASGAAYGNREALLSWVRDLDILGCDRFVLSLDQLLSGGLVNSRSLTASAPLTFGEDAATDEAAASSTMDEAAAFDAYILPLAEDPSNRVYLFDSVVRLSPTVGYQGLTEEEYYALRAYGMASRPALSGEDLTLEAVFGAYPFAADGVTPAEETLDNDRFRELLTEERLRDYLAVRRRKLSLLDSVLRSVQSIPPDGGSLRLLIGVDDSSNAANIQYNELRWLEQHTGPETTMMAGLDSLARLLIGRIARDESGEPLRTAVRYVGGSQFAHSSEFDLYTLEDVVRLHLDFFGAEQVSPSEAELQIVVMTAPDDPERAEEYREELLSLLEENLARGIPTVLDEASNRAYGDALDEALLERIPFGELVAYAGKYDQANVTGAALAMGFSRYLYLRRGETDDAAHTAHVRQMAASMALTEYILHTRAPLNEFVEELGRNRNNMGDGTSPEEAQILEELDRLFSVETERVRANLEGSRLLCGVAPAQYREIREVFFSDCGFPWQRTFEIAFRTEAALSPLPETEKTASPA